MRDEDATLADGASPSRRSKPTTLTGRTFGHIRVGRRLGEGGMGEVYEGFDLRLNRGVAVKSLHAEQRPIRSARERFLREARLLSALDHENICRIYDYIETPDTDLLVLELVSGQTLEQIDRDDPERLDFRDRLLVARSVADALAAAHQRGIIHRDLKPGNVMLTEDGEVKVLDFGLGRSTGSAERVVTVEEDDLTLDEGAVSPAVMEQGISLLASSQLTAQGFVMGTPHYMSPEQARGDTIGVESDVYSLGLLLQRLFTGKSPYAERRDGSNLLVRAQLGESDEPTSLRRDVRQLLSDLKQLEPRDRPTAAEARQRIDRILDRPQRMMRALLVAALFAVAALASVKYVFDLQQERTAAEQARALEAQARGRAEAAQYLANVQLAALRLDEGNGALAQRALQRAPATLRNWEWGHLWNRATQRAADATEDETTSVDGDTAAEIWRQARWAAVERALVGHTVQVHDLAFSPDGDRLLTSSRDGTARIWSISTVGSRDSVELAGDFQLARWSPDGRSIVGGEFEVALWDAQEGVATRTLRREGDMLQDALFDSTGRVTTVHFSTGVLIQNPHTGEDEGSFELRRGTRASRLAHAEGDPPVLVATWGDQAVRRWSYDGIAQSTVRQPAPDAFSVVSLSSDGRLAASQRSSGGPISIWDTTDGREVTTVGHENTLPTPLATFSTDGTVIASRGSERALHLHDTRSGVLLSTIDNVPITDAALAFDAQGRRLAVPDRTGTVRILTPRSEAPPPIGTLAGHSDVISILQFDASGQKLVSAGYDDQVRVWQMPAGDLQTSLPLPAEPHDMDLAQSGELLVHTWNGEVRLFDLNRAGAEALLVAPERVPPPDFLGGPRGSSWLIAASLKRGSYFTPDGAQWLSLDDSGLHIRQNPTTDARVETIRLLPIRASASGFRRFTPDGSRIVYVCPGLPECASPTPTVWGASSGELLHRLEAHAAGAIVQMEISPDSRYLVTCGSDDRILIWDLEQGTLHAELEGHQAVAMGSHFDAESQRLVTASFDQTARIWNVSDGALLATLVGHEGPVINALWSPNGSRILTTSVDQTVRVWDPEGHLLTTLRFEDPVRHSIWSPDGAFVAVSSGDGNLRLFSGLVTHSPDATQATATDD